ncbi:MAG: hypothetical protein OXF05_00070 [Hyphomicrobiales bacterium]|nr:hypothetical protein [Hyphomicrobiales bacterium]
MENPHNFRVPTGRTSHNVTVCIIDNDDDAGPGNQMVKFNLSADSNNNFPAGWGVEEFFDIFTLAVTDDDNSASAPPPPRLPAPIRPPTQETSPKPDEFQKKAEANPQGRGEESSGSGGRTRISCSGDMIPNQCR